VLALRLPQRRASREGVVTARIVPAAAVILAAVAVLRYRAARRQYDARPCQVCSPGTWSQT